MPLPTLNTPKYQTIVPSTGKEIEYRPFLVKEEKILLIAQESKSNKEILRAMKDIISACTFGAVNADDCTMYDIEYLFLQLRAKSVGEIANVQIRCSKCNEYVPVEINLEDVQVVFPKKKIETKIQLTDSVGLTLKPVTFKVAQTIKTDNDITGAIASVIDTIYDENNVYTLADATAKEIDEFINSLNRKQLEKIQEFIENQPQLQHMVEFECNKCGHKNKHVLKGIQSFFA